MQIIPDAALFRNELYASWVVFGGKARYNSSRKEAGKMDQAKTGRFIAARRKELGLTQRQLAERLSISDKTVSKWECGVSQS